MELELFVGLDDAETAIFVPESFIDMQVLKGRNTVSKHATCCTARVADFEIATTQSNRPPPIVFRRNIRQRRPAFQEIRGVERNTAMDSLIETATDIHHNSSGTTLPFEHALEEELLLFLLVSESLS
jgi:hypothetical protein